MFVIARFGMGTQGKRRGHCKEEEEEQPKEIENKGYREELSSPTLVIQYNLNRQVRVYLDTSFFNLL